MSNAKSPPESDATLLAAIECVLALESGAGVLDMIAEQAARVAGFGAGVLTYARAHGTWLGSFNHTSDQVAALARHAASESLAERIVRRRRIRASAFEGTGIAHVREPPAPLEDERGARSPAWHGSDRVYIFVRGGGDADAGLLALHEPVDPRGVHPQRLAAVMLAERFLSITASCAEAHLRIRWLEDAVAQVRGMLEPLADGVPSLAGGIRGSRTDERPPRGLPAGAADLDTLEAVQRRHVVGVLERTAWVIQGPRGAAAVLGMGASTLRSRMRRLGIRRPP